MKFLRFLLVYETLSFLLYTKKVISHSYSLLIFIGSVSKNNISIETSSKDINVPQDAKAEICLENLENLVDQHQKDDDKNEADQEEKTESLIVLKGFIEEIKDFEEALDTLQFEGGK